MAHPGQDVAQAAVPPPGVRLIDHLHLAAVVAFDPQEPEWGLCDHGLAQQHRLMPPPDMSIPIVYRGQRFPSRKALALHLAPLLGQSVNTLLSRLTRYDGDVERAIVGRHELCEPRPTAFEGQVFPSRQALARHLSPLLGRSVTTLASLLSRYDGDVERVVRSTQRNRFRPIAFGGRVFPTRAGGASRPPAAQIAGGGRDAAAAPERRRGALDGREGPVSEIVGG